MPSNIMRRIQDNVNPTSVSNAIYEIMVDWRAYTMRINNKEPKGTRLRDKRAVLEMVLSRFFNCDTQETRRLLAEHFGIEAQGR